MQPGTLYRRSRQNIVDHPDVWKWSTIAVAIVLAGIALVWAWRQVRPRADGRISTTVVTSDRPRQDLGRNRWRWPGRWPVTWSRCRGLAPVKVRMVSMATRPQLVAMVSIRDDADPDQIRQGAEASLRPPLPAPLRSTPVDVDLRLRPTDEVAARVI